MAKQPHIIMTTNSWDSLQSQQSRHLALPFNLRDPKIRLCSDEVFNSIRRLLPEIINVAEGRCGGYLVLAVESYPPRPWPLTVGGLPFILNSGMRIPDDISMTDGVRLTGGFGRVLLFPIKEASRPSFSLKICPHLYRPHLYREEQMFSSRELQDIADELSGLVASRHPGVKVFEVMACVEGWFFIILSHKLDWKAIRALPGLVAGLPTGYMLDSALKRPATWADQLTAAAPKTPSAQGVLAGSGEAMDPSTGATLEGCVVAKSLRLFHSPSSSSFSSSSSSVDNDGHCGEVEYVTYDWSWCGQQEGGDGDEESRIIPDNMRGSLISDIHNHVTGTLQFYVGEGGFKGFAASIRHDEAGSPAPLVDIQERLRRIKL